MTDRPVAWLARSASLMLTAGLAFSQPALADPIYAGNPTLAPLKWAGMYRYREPDGIYQCTAQFITPRVIMLAAHCLWDVNTGQFWDQTNKNSLFYLQYQNDEYTKVYRPVCSGTLGGYVVPLKDGEDPKKPDTMSEQRLAEYKAAMDVHWQFDFGFVLLDADSITGHYNYKINVTAERAASTGYPGAIMGGEVIQYVYGDIVSTKDLYSYHDDVDVQMLWHGNPAHTQGASGGAWVANFSHDVSPETNIIVGLNSFHDPSHLGASFGPVFTDSFQKLLTFVQNGCK